MKEFALYALEANIYLVLFAGLYFAAFRSTPHHLINRLYLLGSILCAWYIPSLELSSQLVSALPQLELSTIYLSSAASTETNDALLRADQILPALYIAGVAALTGILIIHFTKTIRVLGAGEKESMGGLGIVSIHSSEAWSFFNYIVIGKKIPANHLAWIIAHESVHVREMHSLDRLLFGVAKALGWFNPAVYLLEKAIEENHEFRADEVVCNLYDDQSTYSYVLLSQAMGGINHRVLVHPFSKKSMLKSRIQMINTTKQTGKMKYLLTIPVLAVALLMHSCAKEESVNSSESSTELQKSIAENDPEVYKVVEKMPEFKGGMDGLIAFMGEHTVYPEEAKSSEDEGKVLVMFVVDEQGNVTEPSVIERGSSSSTALRQAALETISKMPAWSPGEQNGKKVKVQLVLPIKFELS
jgi:TonB family protein